MSTWEKDEHGNFAGRNSMFDTGIASIGSIPFVGIVVMFVAHITAGDLDGYIGVKQQRNRTVDIVAAIQFIECCIYLLVVL